MINISDVVSSVINSDDIALEAMSRGYMNFSKYARIINDEVEKQAFKKVDEKSIVVALSRIAENTTQNTSKENLRILNLSVHSDLEEISFPRTQDTLQKIKELYKIIPENLETFFTATQGITEITIIAETEILKSVKKIFKGNKALYNLKDLSGITAKFTVQYLSTPNVIHNISKRLAIKNINIIEVVSTTTEITYIIEKQDTQSAVGQLAKLL